LEIINRPTFGAFLLDILPGQPSVWYEIYYVFSR